MNRESREVAPELEDESEDTEALSAAGADDDDESEDTDNIGDVSVEINVDELISEMEAAGLSTKHFKGQPARKRLDEILEEKRFLKDMSDFDDFDFD
jgi:hypothetical protein